MCWGDYNILLCNIAAHYRWVIRRERRYDYSTCEVTIVERAKCSEFSALFMFFLHFNKCVSDQKTRVEYYLNNFYVLNFYRNSARNQDIRIMCQWRLFKWIVPRYMQSLSHSNLKGTDVELTSVYHRTSQVNSAILIYLRECHMSSEYECKA